MADPYTSHYLMQHQQIISLRMVALQQISLQVTPAYIILLSNLL